MKRSVSTMPKIITSSIKTMSPCGQPATPSAAKKSCPRRMRYSMFKDEGGGYGAVVVGITSLYSRLFEQSADCKQSPLVAVRGGELDADGERLPFFLYTPGGDRNS